MGRPNFYSQRWAYWTVTDAELADKLLEAVAIIDGGGELWDDEWSEIFADAADALDPDD